jgi:hypothetical protein
LDFWFENIPSGNPGRKYVNGGFDQNPWHLFHPNLTELWPDLQRYLHFHDWTWWRHLQVNVHLLFYYFTFTFTFVDLFFSETHNNNERYFWQHHCNV